MSKNIIVMLGAIFCLQSLCTQAEQVDPEIEELLSKKCLQVYKTYLSKDLNGFLGFYHHSWVDMGGEKYFRDLHSKKSTAYLKKYGNPPKILEVIKVEPGETDEKEAKRFGVSAAVDVSLRVDGEMKSLRTHCRFNYMNDGWFLRKAP